MDCPKCQKEMEVKFEKTTYSKEEKEYSSTQYVCKLDDIWIRIETPKEETQSSVD
ncbi:MAG TPA: hypothetical protein VFK07_02570 [Candidatus Paceibacterota bacterium]|nr:hypothetical protein [Candidatus Paceibacterota bacterium]